MSKERGSPVGPVVCNICLFQVKSGQSVGEYEDLELTSYLPKGFPLREMERSLVSRTPRVFLEHIYTSLLL